MVSEVDKKDHIIKLAGLTWQQMMAASIPPSPDNFRVWYTYFADLNLDLKREIDRLLIAKESFTSEVNASLRELLSRGDSDPVLLAEIHEATGEIISGIIKGVTTANTSNEDYQKDIKKFAKDLKNIKSAQGLWDMMSGLEARSRKMESSTTILQDLLGRATADIKELETRLEETEKAANTDSLTGINNRHVFEKKMFEVCRDFKPETPFSLILLDIDHFKRFNDTYGHRVGDTVLRGVAQVFSPNIPENGFPARYGGEEFAIILPGLKLVEAVVVADKLREVIYGRELRRGSDGARLGRITISLGVAEARFDDDTESLVERADKALYRAKDNGRNRVESEVFTG